MIISRPAAKEGRKDELFIRVCFSVKEEGGTVFRKNISLFGLVTAAGGGEGEGPDVEFCAGVGRGRRKKGAGEEKRFAKNSNPGDAGGGKKGGKRYFPLVGVSEGGRGGVEFERRSVTFQLITQVAGGGGTGYHSCSSGGGMERHGLS